MEYMMYTCNCPTHIGKLCKQLRSYWAQSLPNARSFRPRLHSCIGRHVKVDCRITHQQCAVPKQHHCRLECHRRLETHQLHLCGYALEQRSTHHHTIPDLLDKGHQPLLELLGLLLEAVEPQRPEHTRKQGLKQPRGNP